ncbi:hypothetical protein SmJEL517_g00504 [Synchytrium microbalum]|uniref:RWD domain-containing protein n=1 Tax=Synchytrium microbalum TaxID=1806994 RepID=A0A507CII8_9FUNG|nr:uncharacterized protein SmJEL517_g00504 [Synchytrium microbalum]TPX37525.1 hypothetical protein SmJEL517_g00504 [Synchytrium microbalum]
MSSNHEEEQRNELEALQAIYPDEFTALSDKEFSIEIHADDYPECSLSLKITYPSSYPDIIPEIELEDDEGINEEELEYLKSNAIKEAESNLGMASVFAIVASTKDCLESTIKKRLELAAHQAAERIRLEEEAEAIRFAGSKVTPEVFDAWWERFQSEMAAEELRIAKEKGIQLDRFKGKLTGRQLFEKDKTLAASDVKLVGVDDVAVDMHLFEGLDDLDSDDEDDNEVLANIRGGGDD